MRTSQSHPLWVDAIAVGAGQVGMTICLGKTGSSLFGTEWDRDLGADVAALRDWGADVVVTLVESVEMRDLGVPGLGEAVVAAGMEWRHAPITDVSVPDAAFEEAWPALARELVTRLESGGRVVVHCRGGLGRTGLLAAMLAIEAGETPAGAVARVRAARPGAIETLGQESYVEAYRPVLDDFA